MDDSTLIILYETRVLLREALKATLTANGNPVIVCHTMEQLAEELCSQKTLCRTLLVGAGGLGSDLTAMLRIMHYTETMVEKTVVYLPVPDALLTRLFLGARATHCLAEKELGDKLLPLLREQNAKLKRDERLSLSELDVLIDYSCGLQTREIADRGTRSYKTVFTIKRNARLHLGIESKSGWLGLLSKMSQLSSVYD